MRKSTLQGTTNEAPDDGEVSRAQLQAQAAEQRLREVLEQNEVLKRSTNAVRASLEAEIHAANKHAEQSEKAREHSNAMAEQLRAANKDLTAALETVQCRLADLESERAVLQQEIERLHAERTADPERVVRLKAEVVALQWALDAQRVAAEQSRAAATAELTALRTGHEEELTAWQDVAGQHEAELLAAQSELTHRLEETQAKLDALEPEAAALAAQVAALSERIAGLEAERAAALQQCVEFEQRLAATVAAHQEAETELQTQRETERAELLGRLALVEQELHGRDSKISELNTAIEALGRENTAIQDSAAEAARQREVEWETARQRWHAEIEEARQATAMAEARSEDLQTQLTTREGELHGIKASCTELTSRLQELNTHHAAQLQAQAEAGAQMQALENERDALQVRVEQLTTLAAQLQRDCERLRSELIPAEEGRRLQNENARLEARIRDIERQHAEAVQRHSAAVAGYMVELNQRAEAVQERERESHRLAEELELMRGACEDATAQLVAEREERDDLQRQLTELRAAASGTSRPAAPSSRAVPAAGRPASAPTPSQPRPPVNIPAKPARSTPVSGPFTVVHLEQNKAFRDAVSGVLVGRPGSQYLNAPETDRSVPGAAQVFVVNLLNRTPDSLEVIRTVAADPEPQRIIAYCADGPHGLLFGMVDLLVAPIEADTCVARLLESHGALQRLLAVSENIEMMGALRAALSRMRCSTSVALDLRQVTDLLTMIDPEIVLVDLALPGGDALRLLSRLRADPKTRDLPMALLLSPTFDASDFRRHALRTVHEQTLSPADLAEALRRCIDTGGPVEEPPVAATQTA
jgi:CheY-like chemotaxis protein